MFTLGCHFAHQASEVTEFVFSQSALPPPDRKLPNAFRGIPSDDAETSGVAEQGPQGTNRSTGDAGAPGRPAPASFRPSAKAPPSARLAPTRLRERATLHSPHSRRQSSLRSPFRVKTRCNSQGMSHCAVRWHFRLRRWQGGAGRSRVLQGPRCRQAVPSSLRMDRRLRARSLRLIHLALAQTEHFSLWRATQPFGQPPECA